LQEELNAMRRDMESGGNEDTTFEKEIEFVGEHLHDRENDLRRDSNLHKYNFNNAEQQSMEDVLEEQIKETKNAKAVAESTPTMSTRMIVVSLAK
jgi:hypothetical protein